MVIRGMVYYCYTNITHLINIHPHHSIQIGQLSILSVLPELEIRAFFKVGMLKNATEIRLRIQNLWMILVESGKRRIQNHGRKMKTHTVTTTCSNIETYFESDHFVISIVFSEGVWVLTDLAVVPKKHIPCPVVTYFRWVCLETGYVQIHGHIVKRNIQIHTVACVFLQTKSYG